MCSLHLLRFKLTAELRNALFRNNVTHITKLILHTGSLKSEQTVEHTSKWTVLCNWEKLKNKTATTLAELTVVRLLHLSHETGRVPDRQRIIRHVHLTTTAFTLRYVRVRYI